MRTECTQVPFEFHGLFQRKVKARLDCGTITCDVGVGFWCREPRDLAIMGYGASES